jgi:pimeloyl-ACP methyl ester carboxylesterase
LSSSDANQVKSWKHVRDVLAVFESSQNRFTAFTVGFSYPGYALLMLESTRPQPSLVATVLLIGAFFLFVVFALAMVMG